MKNHINIRFYKIPKEKNFNEMGFEEFKIQENSIVLLSKLCYLNLCNNDFYFDKPGSPTNNFWIKNSNYHSISSATIKPIHATDWYQLKSFYFQNNSFYFNGDIPTEVLFIYYDDEFEEKHVNAFFVIPNESENPTSFIMKDLPEFKNSMFFLTINPYLELKRTTSMVSSYEGIERLTWLLDEGYNYCGGTIMLNSLTDHSLYFIENMSFPSFSKTFSITGFPDTLYFII